MEREMVVQEGHVPWLEGVGKHQFRVIGHLFKHRQGFLVHVGQPTCFGVALRTFNVQRQGKRTHGKGELLKDMTLVKANLPRGLFTAPVDAELGIDQVACHIRVFFDHLVEHGLATDDLTFSARGCLLEAKQYHVVRAIGVHIEGAGRLVRAGRRIIQGLAFVDDVAQQLASQVLLPWLADVHAQTPENRTGLVFAVTFHRQVADVQNTKAEIQLFFELGKFGYQIWDGEISRTKVRHHQAAGLNLAQGSVQFLYIIFAQVVNPTGTLLLQCLCIPGCAVAHFLNRIHHSCLLHCLVIEKYVCTIYLVKIWMATAASSIPCKPPPFS